MTFKVCHTVYAPYALHYNLWLVHFYPIFHCGLYCRAVSITDSSFKSRAGYNTVLTVLLFVSVNNLFSIFPACWYQPATVYLVFNNINDLSLDVSNPLINAAHVPYICLTYSQVQLILIFRDITFFIVVTYVKPWIHLNGIYDMYIWYIHGFLEVQLRNAHNWEVYY